MKNIYVAPEALEIILDTKDLITVSNDLVTDEEGDGEIIEW